MLLPFKPFSNEFTQGWVPIIGDSFKKGFSPIPMEVTLIISRDKPLVKGCYQVITWFYVDNNYELTKLFIVLHTQVLDSNV